MSHDPGRRSRAAIFAWTVLLLGGGSFVYFCWALRPLILPIVLGVLLAYLFRPLKSAFKYHWIPESARVALIFTTLVAGLLLSIKFVQANIPNEKEKLEIQVRLKYKFDRKFNEILGFDPASGKGNSFYNLVSEDVGPMRTAVDGFLSLSQEQKESFLRFVKGVEGYAPVPENYHQYFLESERAFSSEALTAELKKSAETTKVMEHPPSLLLEVMDLVSIWLVLPFVFVFFLIDEDSIVQFLIGLVPNRFFELTLMLRERVDVAIGEYLRGICLECILVAISMAIGFYLMGFPLNMSLLISALSGLATAIPFLGPVVGIGFGMVYVLIAEQLHPILPFISESNSPLAVIVVNIIVLALDNLVFQPIVLGGAVNLHPLVIVVGLTGGSMLFGLAGVLLAIPAIVVANVVISCTFRGLKDYRII